MNQIERQNRIVEYLRIKPGNHGQINTSQIAVPKSQIVEIPYQRREVLKNSLTEQGSNLIPLIVRRTEAYKEEEYEIVYGTDWCIVAKELNLEKVWVWVFDMTDEQAAAAKEQMQQLASLIEETIPPNQTKQIKSSDGSVKQPKQIKNLLQILENSFKQEVNTLKKQIEEINTLKNQVDKSVKSLEDVLSEKLEVIRNEIDGIEPEKIAPKTMTIAQLRVIAKQKGINVPARTKKAALIIAIEESEKS